jgi:hypothetical protein
LLFRLPGFDAPVTSEAQGLSLYIINQERSFRDVGTPAGKSFLRGNIAWPAALIVLEWVE